uniref:Uncharacterized protein n=1 Tax=Euplotes harpa TaxID=151035 RepID=A0A7S3J7J2_9SPIT|mmetsp:Transcript_21665/g.24929  ORF Transcript_21665/g.24929 Transcript_21665/m.24929 type:complete len:107 (+) Transcript_21665:356-676(+)
MLRKKLAAKNLNRQNLLRDQSQVGNVADTTFTCQTSKKIHMNRFDIYALYQSSLEREIQWKMAFFIDDLSKYCLCGIGPKGNAYNYPYNCSQNSSCDSLSGRPKFL